MLQIFFLPLSYRSIWNCYHLHKNTSFLYKNYFWKRQKSGKNRPSRVKNVTKMRLNWRNFAFYGIKKAHRRSFDPARAWYALEVPPRFELGNKGFADLGLTTWRWHHIMERKTRLELATPTLARWCSTNWAISAKWRPEGDLNPWPPPWQGGILTN